ncbi:MAG TPA: PH domain-containing protein [Jatrophihabitans sp.]|nr:PH domain-containing protein [Jatrophihabitans sp.]
MSSGSGTRARAFRLPRSAYLIVLFLAFGCAPIAFTGHGIESEPAVIGFQTLILLVPVIAAVFIARWATFVGSDGITVRAAFGTRLLRWAELDGLSVSGRSVYAVTRDGSWRLPCVHVNDLGALSRASAGRLPELPTPTPKRVPQRRRR